MFTRKFRIGDIQPNPFRHLERYPINREKVAPYAPDADGGPDANGGTGGTADTPKPPMPPMPSATPQQTEPAKTDAPRWRVRI